MCDAKQDTAKQIVNDLYLFRDRFFESHPLSAAGEKSCLVADKLQSTLTHLTQLEENAIPSSAAERAMWLLLRGKCLNVTENFNADAFEALSKAVKLQPTLLEAWCQLGECYWKKGDVRAAHNCFNSALGHGRDRSILRSLSMVLRALPASNPEERAKFVSESVDLAKEAVQADINDGRSWTVLANAYFAQYVQLGQPSSLMRKCLSAYSQAEKDPIAVADSDLHHNRAVARLQLGELTTALAGLERAAALDPAWSAPRDKAAALRSFISEAFRLTQQRGAGLRDKKLRQAQAALREKRGKDLALYANRMESSTLSQLLSDNLLAKNRSLLLKVVCAVPDQLQISYPYLAIDEEASSVLLILFNTSSAYCLHQGDFVTVPEPLFDRVYVPENDNKNNDFFLIVRVTSPEQLCVNGRRLSSNVKASPVFSSELCTE